jgi:hypothetical protein
MYLRTGGGMSGKDLLKQSAYFNELDETALDELSRLCKEEVYKSGDVVFRENEKLRNSISL